MEEGQGAVRPAQNRRLSAIATENRDDRWPLLTDPSKLACRSGDRRPEMMQQCSSDTDVGGAASLARALRRWTG